METESDQAGGRVWGGSGDHQPGGGAGGWRGNVPGISLHTYFKYNAKASNQNM